MRDSETVHAEPHDSIEAPSYRLNFWQRSNPEHAWSQDAHVLTEVENITEVLQWIDERAEGRRFELFVEMEQEPVGPFLHPRTAGLVRLLGTNPNRGKSVELARFEKID